MTALRPPHRSGCQPATALGERERRCVRGTQAHLVFRLSGNQSRSTSRHEKRRNGPALPRRRGDVRPRHHHDDVGDVTVGDPRFHPVQHPAVAVLLRASRNAGGIRATAGFREREGAEDFAARHRLSQPVLLRGGPVAQQGAGNDRVMNAEGDRDSWRPPRKFLPGP